MSLTPCRHTWHSQSSAALRDVVRLRPLGYTHGVRNERWQRRRWRRRRQLIDSHLVAAEVAQDCQLRRSLHLHERVQVEERRRGHVQLGRALRAACARTRTRIRLRTAAWFRGTGKV
jgi:hypothetical protein